MSNRKISMDMSNRTFSQESAAGLSPCVLPDGQMAFPFGQDHVLANRFRAPVSDEDTKTSGTSGRSGSASSASASLQSYLASRLRARMDLNGSMEYLLIWKARVTPARRRICALRASHSVTCITQATQMPVGGYEEHP